MITRMQEEQDQRIREEGGPPVLASPNSSEIFTSPLGSPQPGPSNRDGNNRPSTLTDTSPTQRVQKNTSVWNTRICVKPLDKYSLK